MMRRLLNLLTFFTLLLCVATCVLWVRGRAREDSVSRVLRGDRYMILSTAGAIRLFAPPPPAADAGVRRAAGELVASLRNDQICWLGCWLSQNGEGWLAVRDVPGPLGDTPADRADKQFAVRDLARPLLAALEDPGRFTVAHVLLLRRWGPRRTPQPSSWPVADRLLGECPSDFGNGEHRLAPWTEVELDGLTVTLSRWKGRGGGYTSHAKWVHALGGDADVAQLPRVRAQWHRRLDVPVVTIPHWQAAAATAALPLVHVARRARSALLARRRRKTGLCPACGYDLTANVSGVCPECGAGSAPRRCHGP